MFSHIKLPSNLKSIAYDAFRGCFNLKSIEVDTSLPYITITNEKYTLEQMIDISDEDDDLSIIRELDKIEHDKKKFINDDIGSLYEVFVK